MQRQARAKRHHLSGEIGCQAEPSRRIGVQPGEACGLGKARDHRVAESDGVTMVAPGEKRGLGETLPVFWPRLNQFRMSDFMK